MLEHGEGHILTVASVMGLVGVPSIANYSASKAAVIAFTHALRAELRGTGVSATVVCPGFMLDAGAYVPYRTQTPWYLGSTTTDRVARAAVRALRRDRPEAIVNTVPIRPLTLLRACSPRAAQALLCRLGLPGFTAGLAARHLPYSS
jgi:short-subunit dehydrogenase